MGRAYRNTPLTKAQKQNNQRNAGFRCTVERVFGVFKLYYGMGHEHYLGLARNAVLFGLMCFAYNLKRGINIQRSCNRGVVHKRHIIRLTLYRPYNTTPTEAVRF